MLCFLLFMIFMLHSIIVHAEDYTTDDKTPDEIKPFIEKGPSSLSSVGSGLPVG